MERNGLSNRVRIMEVSPKGSMLWPMEEDTLSTCEISSAASDFLEDEPATDMNSSCVIPRFIPIQKRLPSLRKPKSLYPMRY